jgi:hypothetical protein
MLPRCGKKHTVALFIAIGLSFACGNTQVGDTAYADSAQLQVTNAAFVSANGGREIKLAGASPSGQLSLVRVTLYDKNGKRVETDTNDDGIVDSSSIDLPVVQSADNRAFFIELPLPQACSMTITRVGIQVIDQLGTASEVAYAQFDDLPQRTQGAACDARGFDKCPAGTICTQTAGEWQAHCMSATAP